MSRSNKLDMELRHQRIHVRNHINGGRFAGVRSRRIVVDLVDLPQG